MPVIVLRHPLRDLAGGNTRVEVSGGTVAEVLRDLEQLHPPMKGWVLDEQGHIRRHVNVFVDGERATTDVIVSPDSELNIIQAISGGAF